MTMKPGGATLPLYQQIYDDLEQKINTGEIRYMEQLPILPALCKIYGVSDAPVRRALDELARNGLIIRSRGRGKGTYAIKRLEKRVIRVLLIANFDIYRSAIETCHEVFDLLLGVQEAARAAGCELQRVSRNGYEALRPAGAGTGYLIIAMSQEEYAQGIRLAEHHHAPCVLVNPAQAGHHCVRVDMEQGAFLGVNYLAQCGHRRIAYVGATRSEWFEPRYTGYRRALAVNGLEPDAALVQETGGIDPQQDREALDRLLALPEPPTAIFACSDYRALHLLTYCKQRDISVPGQLSLCGYDDIGEAVSVEPGLTTVRHPRQELGPLAVERLIRLLDEHSEATTEILDDVVKPHLIVRESCAVPSR